MKTIIAHIYIFTFDLQIGQMNIMGLTNNPTIDPNVTLNESWTRLKQ